MGAFPILVSEFTRIFTKIMYILNNLQNDTTVYMFVLLKNDVKAELM